ncbi:hypothetical protein Lepto7375DRAFT_3870 [Leptolyngbya sp. PCC 7375]|nr:hypothetical protein Lepto7375DRAFT_3870 [Leptolyngbya sp. PCC 7375]
MQESLETHQLWIDEQTPLKLVVKQRLKRCVLLAMGVAYGGLRSRILILDQLNRLYSRKVYTLLGTRGRQYPLDEIQAIITKEFRHHRNGRLRRVYGLEICLQSNKKHRLPTMRRREAVNKIVVQMQSFLSAKSIGKDGK